MKRYTPLDDGEMVLDETQGSWCEHADVEKLERENASLRRQLTEMLEGMPTREEIEFVAPALEPLNPTYILPEQFHKVQVWLRKIAAMDIEREGIVNEEK